MRWSAPAYTTARYDEEMLAYGEGLPFTQREADVYRELCATVTAAGKTAGGRRRVDLMIAAVAVAHNAALATRNSADFIGLESVLDVLQL